MIEATQSPMGIMARAPSTRTGAEVAPAEKSDARGARTPAETEVVSGQAEASSALLQPGMNAARSPQARQAAEESPGDSQPMDLEKAVESINDYLQANQRALEFSLDDDSGVVVVKVMDAERKEVIRQIPPEQVLKLMAQMRDGTGISGLGLTQEA